MERYTLESVKKIDNYSRRIFPSAYIIFVLYFFIRLIHCDQFSDIDKSISGTTL